jgi:hypothetical protein
MQIIFFQSECLSLLSSPCHTNKPTGPCPLPTAFSDPSKTQRLTFPFLIHKLLLQAPAVVTVVQPCRAHDENVEFGARRLAAAVSRLGGGNAPRAASSRDPGSVAAHPFPRRSLSLSLILTHARTASTGMDR